MDVKRSRNRNKKTAGRNNATDINTGFEPPKPAAGKMVVKKIESTAFYSL